MEENLKSSYAQMYQCAGFAEKTLFFMDKVFWAESGTKLDRYFLQFKG